MIFHKNASKQIESVTVLSKKESAEKESTGKSSNEKKIDADQLKKIDKQADKADENKKANEKKEQEEHEEFDKISNKVTEKTTRSNPHEDNDKITGYLKTAAMAMNAYTGPMWLKASIESNWGNGIRNKLQEPFNLKTGEDNGVNIVKITPEDWKKADTKVEKDRVAFGLGPAFGNCRTMSAQFCNKALEKIESDPKLKDCQVRWVWSQAHSWAEIKHPGGNVSRYDPWMAKGSNPPVSDSKMRSDYPREAQSAWYGKGWNKR